MNVRLPSIPALWESPLLQRIRRSAHWTLGFYSILLLSAVVLMCLVERLNLNHDQVRLSLAIEQRLRDVLQLTVDVETATHGFVLTGDAGFLEPATNALPILERQTRELRTMLRGNEEQLSELGRLRDCVGRRVAIAQFLIAAPGAAGSSGQASLATHDGKREQDEIRALVAHMVAREREVLGERVDRGVLVSRSLQSFIIFSTALLSLSSWMWLRARRRFQRSENNYAHLFATAANGMALVGTDGQILRANSSYCAMLGYAPGELDGRAFGSLKHPSEREHGARMFALLLSGERETVRNERRYVDRDGAEIWIRSTLWRTPATADDGARVLVVAEDVSDRVRNEEMLRRSAALVRNASRMAGIDGWFLPLPRGPLQLGAHALQVLGLEDADPMALLSRLTPASRRMLLRALAGCRRHGTPFDLELDGVRANSAPIGLRVMGAAVQGRAGVTGIEGALHDVTEARRHQHILRHNEQRFRAAAQVTTDGIWDWRIEGDSIWRSDSLAALLGMDAAALGKDSDAWRHRIHPEDRDQVYTGLASALEGADDEIVMEYRVMRADGAYAHVVDKARILRDDDGTAVRVIGGVEDLTERKRAQQAIMQMAASVPSSNPQAFFTALLHNMLQALGADGGAVARVRPDIPGRVHTIAAVADGAPLENFEFDWADVPFDALRATPELVVRDGLDARWLKSMAWPGRPARGYVGSKLFAADGSELGFLYAVFRSPMEEVEVATRVLRVFATRASAELERIEAAVRVREQAGLLEHAQEAIMVLGLDLRIRFWNRGAERMYGWASELVHGHTVLDCYTDHEHVRRALQLVLEGEQWQGESLQRRRDGSIVTVEERWTLVRNDAGEPYSVLKIGSDVTDKRAAEEEIRRLAYYDALTGLPNRRLLLDRLEQLRLRCARRGRSGALLFIDMDNFKTLNDQHGHDMGDEFLRRTAERLRACVRADDTVARLGGDEFVVLLDNLDPQPELAAQQTRAVGASIVDAFRHPIELGTHTHLSTTSIGAVLVHDAQDSISDVLAQADRAMYQAKRSRNTFCLATAAEHEPSPLHPDELTSAIAGDELALWLNPKVDAGARVIGALVELRWQHPVRGLLEPSEFMPLAERCGQMVDIGDWILRHALRLLSDWKNDPERAHLELALPVSAQQMRDDRFVERVEHAVRDAHSVAHRLTLELPGSALDIDATLDKLARIRAAGPRVAITDLGGPSPSLERLRRTQVDELQINPRLLSNIAERHVDQAIVTLLLELGRALEVRVLAAGIDDTAQHLTLCKLGCLAFQGPLYGPATPIEQFAHGAAETWVVGQAA